MTAHKQSLPSFASVISVLSIVLYCAGFLRVEMELREQIGRINALENAFDGKPPTKHQKHTNFAKTAKNAPEAQLYNLNRNRRNADTAKTCQSCPPGPPGPTGPRGQKGTRGRRGQKGRTGYKGDRGIMGSPEKSGQQGIMGPVGPQGEAGIKGQKGDVGLTGLPGAKGEPGESISAPTVAVSPAKVTVNENGSASFQCSVTGNPEPAVVWSKLNSQSETNLLAVSRGKLRLLNVQGNDSGVYKCSATNILGKAVAVAELVVNVRPFVSLHPGPNYVIKHNNVTLPTCHVETVTSVKTQSKIAKDCSDLFKSGHTQSGVYSVNPDGKGSFNVCCDMRTDGGGWTVFQRRQDGSVDFYRGWNDYKSGFGRLTTEFWLGNDKIHRLTASRASSLRVELEDWNGVRAYAKYGRFNIGDEQAQYRLEVGSYSGTAGDSLEVHNNMAFSTKDRDNDRNSGYNCAVYFTGAWWYDSCQLSNLNGKYLGEKIDHRAARWYHFRDYLSLKFTEMKMKPSS